MALLPILLGFLHRETPLSRRTRREPRRSRRGKSVEFDRGLFWVRAQQVVRRRGQKLKLPKARSDADCYWLAIPRLSCETPLMLLGTPTLYLEHSAVSNETWWPPINAVLATGQVRLALSLWNLVEIGSGADRKQQGRRLGFLEQHNPLWICERVAVQRQEVERFLEYDKLP
jgi:hypothetical protein